MSTTAATDLASLYWEKLREYLHFAFSLFGWPEQLAQKRWLSRVEHKRICHRKLDALLPDSS